MDAVEETAQHLEHVEEAYAERPMKSRATLVIAFAALVAAPAGYLGARANWETAVHERARTIQTATAQRTLHDLSLESAEFTETNTRSTEAQVRIGAFQDRARVTSGKDRETLRRTASYWDSIINRIDDAHPLPSDESLARGYRPAVIAQQRAAAHAELAEKWTAREIADLGIAGLAAAALVLVAIALALPKDRHPYWFLILATCLVAYGGARLVPTNLNPPHELSDEAINAFAEGTVLQQIGDAPGAVDAFVEAVTIEPDYVSAWESLGNSYLSDIDARTAAWAAEAYGHALVLDHRSGTLLNNLAYAELLSGSTSAATRHATEARRLLPDDPRVEATAAEVFVARGERRAALVAAQRLIANVAKEAPTFREEVFSALRRDEADFTAAGVGATLRDEFFAVFRRAAATLEAFGNAAPKEARGVRVTDTDLSYDRSSLLMKYSIACTGITRGDRIGIRVFERTDLVASEAKPIVAPSAPAVGMLPVNRGTYTVEVYVNGNLLDTERYSF